MYNIYMEHAFDSLSNIDLSGNATTIFVQFAPAVAFVVGILFAFFILKFMVGLFLKKKYRTDPETTDDDFDDDFDDGFDDEY